MKRIENNQTIRFLGDKCFKYGCSKEGAFGGIRIAQLPEVVGTSNEIPEEMFEQTEKLVDLVFFSTESIEVFEDTLKKLKEKMLEHKDNLWQQELERNLTNDF